MHSIIDIAKEMYPDLIVCKLDAIKHDQQLIQDSIDSWKQNNCQVLIYSLDNYANDKKHLSTIRSQYEKFAFTTPGVHNDEKHITNVDYLTKHSCGKEQPVIDHNQQKKYVFVFLVGKLHNHRWHLLESLSKRGVLDQTLLSLQNPEHAYGHLLPKKSPLPPEYEWPEILELGDFQAGWLKTEEPMSMAFEKNIGRVHKKLYTDTAYSIVSETNIDKGINYITEKTWTPIVAEHLLISHGNEGNNYFLEQLGFMMHNDFIPHYDETDHNKITNICEGILKESITTVYQATQKERKHNRELALDEVHWENYHRRQLKSYFK